MRSKLRTGRLVRHLPSLLVGAALACGALHVRAARAEPNGRVVVVVVEGGPGQALSSQLEAHIEAPHSVRPPRPFLTALASRGTLTLSSSVDNRVRDAQLVARARSIANEQHVDIVILVAHPKVHRAMRGHLWVIDAHSDAAVVDQDLAATAAADEAGEIWAAASSLFPHPPPAPPAPPTPQETPVSQGAGDPSSLPVATYQPTQSTAPADVANNPETRSPKGEPEKLTRSRAMVVVELGIGAGSRHVSYVDRITPALRPYDLFAAPWVSAGGEVYPLVRSGLPRGLAGLGATGHYGRAFALASADASGARVGTQWQAFDFGVRDGVDLSRNVGLGVGAGFGVINFDFDRTAAISVLPSVDYRFVRAGVDARGRHGDLSFFGTGAYLAILSTGAMHDVFPRERAGGIEAGLGAAYQIASGFELSMNITYTRFFFSMHPEPGDPNVAGGALDEMAQLSLILAYLL